MKRTLLAAMGGALLLVAAAPAALATRSVSIDAGAAQTIARARGVLDVTLAPGTHAIIISP